MNLSASPFRSQDSEGGDAEIYLHQWERFWGSVRITGVEGQVLWDTVPELAAMLDLARFKEHMNKDLPLLDLGCGNGRQTRFLAGWFKKVIGVDVSPSAIEIARRETVNGSNIEYRVLDVVNYERAELLHAEFGDMHIYMRGVLHVIKESDRSSFISSIEALLGDQGTLYQIEPTSQAPAYFKTLPRDVFSRLPIWIRPGGFDLEARERYFPYDRWDVVDQGYDAVINTIALSDGKEAQVPANYLVLRRANPSGQ